MSSLKKTSELVFSPRLDREFLMLWAKQEPSVNTTDSFEKLGRETSKVFSLLLESFLKKSLGFLSLKLLGFFTSISLDGFMFQIPIRRLFDIYTYA